MDKYNHREIEKKWQQYWDEHEIYKTGEDKQKDKYYILDMFPYPSGAGLHVGHPKGYIATDIFARLKMMQGFNVLHPFGWDAFGLPAENYALKQKLHPRIATEQNIARFKEQMKLLGTTYDWDREINTTDPEFYKWTQWIFLKLFKRGLAYESYDPINWCPSCKTGLANEDLEDGKCERCGSDIERRPLRQWALKITDYADRLLYDLDKLPHWDESIKEMQRNWIGRSEGATIKFPISNFQFPNNAQIQNSKNETDSPSPLEGEGRGEVGDAKIKDDYLEAYTTRPDTLYGCTYMVVAPEHPIIKNYELLITNYQEIINYIEQASHKSDLERQDLQKDKSGVELKGIKAINPVNNEEIPIWVADYVLIHYGTGAIMAVPAHDDRDYEFAKKYDLEIKEVIEPEFGEKKENEQFSKRIVALVINPKNKEVLTLDWGSLCGGHLLVGGGIKEGEDEIKCAMREIIEETGYKNLKFKGKSEIIHHHYTAFNKNLNREAELTGLYFELIDDEKEEISLSEKETGKFQVEWMGIDQALKQIHDPAHNYLLRKLALGAAYTGEGINFDSKAIDGLATKEAKLKMISWLEDNRAGKLAVNYKLKDWVFSRQRYWGEPIPLIFCESCKNKKYEYILIHGYQSDSTTNFFPWLKNELEKDGHKVFCPDLPGSIQPKVDEQVDFILDGLEISENTVILGHSLGGVVALKLLEKYGKKVAKIVLVDSFIKPEFSDKVRDALISKSEGWDFNFDKLKKLADEIILVADKNFPVVKEEQVREMWDKLQARLVMGEPEEEHYKGLIEPGILTALKESGWQAVSESELPLELPDVLHYEPTGTGESPLAAIKEWVEAVCPKCGGAAIRETNTMPQWAGSSWYYLRYIDPHNNKDLVDKEKEKYWSPVDFYVGGAEHATRHLIYARFWHKFLYDIGAVSYDEPFTRLQQVGLILAEDGRKMSKRWGNVINPDEIVEKYGADAMRVYEMFMGPFSQPCAWNTKGLIGARRFLEKVIMLKSKVSARGGSASGGESQMISSLLHKTIKKVTEDIEGFKLNTAVSSMMILVNALSDEKEIAEDAYKILLKLLAPFAPHLAEELYSSFENESIFRQAWPAYDPELIKDETFNLVIQVNGKSRDVLEVKIEITEEEAKNLTLKSEKAAKWIEGKEVVKVIYVKGRLVNIVVR